MWGELHGANTAMTPVQMLMAGGGSYSASMIVRSLKVEWDCCGDDKDTWGTKISETKGVPIEEKDDRLKGGPKIGSSVGHGCDPVATPNGEGK